MAKKAAKKKAGKKAKKPTAAEIKLHEARQAFCKEVAALSADGEKIGLACIWIERKTVMDYLEENAEQELKNEHELSPEDVIEDFINDDLAVEINDNIDKHLKAATWNMLSNL